MLWTLRDPHNFPYLDSVFPELNVQSHLHRSQLESRYLLQQEEGPHNWESYAA